MNTFTCKITAILMFSLVVQNNAAAQSTDIENNESSTAILDTAIPFAIGAREGEQTIRSSFGWPTFQEGFVEGVYFRFDPDGYARFSTSPRLDEEVFEVICQYASTVCVAHKSGMEIGLNRQGNVNFKISGITPDDKFFISDRKSELPLPNSILGPIDKRFEALLSSGGDLIIRRQLETLQEIPLSGFLATVTYLRWVAQNQASFVFPIGWPVPSQQTRHEKNTASVSELWDDSNRLPQTNLIRPKGSLIRSNDNQVLLGRIVENNRGVRQEIPVVPSYYESLDIGFAEQAQGRSLAADINKFPTLQDRHAQIPFDAANINAFKLAVELSKIQQALKNIEIKIGNMETRFAYDFQVLKASSNQREAAKRNMYQSINTNGGVEWGRAETTQKPLFGEDETRKRVIEAIIQQTRDEGELSSSLQIGPAAGEIPIKKSIVERLLEELNGPQQPATAHKKEVLVKPTEFISLSDYINKVIQNEQLR